MQIIIHLRKFFVQIAVVFGCVLIFFLSNGFFGFVESLSGEAFLSLFYGVVTLFFMSGFDSKSSLAKCCLFISAIILSFSFLFLPMIGDWFLVWLALAFAVAGLTFETLKYFKFW